MKHSRHQAYWRRFLLSNERAIHAFGVSGLYLIVFWLVPFVLMLMMALLLGLLNPILALLLTLAALTLLVPILYHRYFVHYAITSQRVMGRQGILHKRFITVDLRSITDIYIHEPFFERLLTRTGTIGINTAGSPGVELWYRHVRKPFELRRDIYRHVQEAMANGKRGRGISSPAPQSTLSS